jgi:hypothetical protein
MEVGNVRPDLDICTPATREMAVNRCFPSLQGWIHAVRRRS